MSKKICSCSVLLIVFLVSLPVTAFGISLNLQPRKVLIGTFYNGTTVEVKGKVPVDAQALILVRGPGEDVHLKKKGKVAGLLWMNTGDVIFKNTPCVYMLYADSDLPASLDAEVGFAALKNIVEISPAGEDKDFLFGEFLKLKKHEFLYSFHAKAISYTSGDGDMRSFKANIVIPPRMHQGSYTIQAFAVRNGHVLDKASEGFQIELVSFPDQISKLAFGHSLLYGIIAVAVALAAGLLIGVLFGSKGGAH